MDALEAESEIKIWETTQVQSGPEWEPRFARNDFFSYTPSQLVNYDLANNYGSLSMHLW